MNETRLLMCKKGKISMTKVLGIFVGFSFFILATISWAGEMSIVHTDTEWNNGKGQVPNKGVCLKYGGESWSPSIKISEIPDAAKTLKLLFTDDNWGKKGGHGNLTVRLNGQNSIDIPPLGGDKNYLPENILGGNGNHCYPCEEEDYLGPCSGGRNHTYRVIVYAIDDGENILAEGTVLLGQF